MDTQLMQIDLVFQHCLLSHICIHIFIPFPDLNLSKQHYSDLKMNGLDHFPNPTCSEEIFSCKNQSRQNLTKRSQNSMT